MPGPSLGVFKSGVVYYPFGLTFNSYQRENSLDQKYLYNGKELQDELQLDWFDYGARMYDPAIARWNRIDPLADAYYANSPLAYVLGNPISNTDQNGMWTVSRHHKMTLEALSTVGIGGNQAELIAHYASVYADNPGELHLYYNNLVSARRDYVSYRSNVDYSTTANSQMTDYRGVGYNYNIWHAMRSPAEKMAYEAGMTDLGISAEDATYRGMRFGWSNVFDAAKSGKKLSDLRNNSKEIRALGQGLHALQDSYAHKGRHDVGFDHILNDIDGDITEASEITRSAVVVYKLMTNDFGSLTHDKVQITTEGMTKDEISQVMRQIGKYFTYLNEREKKKDNKK